MTYSMTIDHSLELATQHYTARQYTQADALCRQILSADPHNAMALNLAGLLAIARGEYLDAEALFRDAIAHTPHLDCVYNNLGIALSHQGKLTEALECYQTVAAHVPDAAMPQSNIGHTLLRLGRVYEALHHYEKAIALDPKLPDIRANYALALLLLGRYTEGWAAYEYRGKPNAGRYSQPVWKGEPLGGRTILLHTEQGFGDTLQFLRYIPLVQNLGGKVILHCPPEIRPLLSGWRGITVVCGNEPPPPFDVQAWLLSLPYTLKTTLETIPRDIPYLLADEHKMPHWRKRLESHAGLKVGLVWAGSKTNVVDAERSIPVDALGPVLMTPNVTFISLQKGRATLDGRDVPAGAHWVDWTEELKDFSDTAALMANLDLVISVDTAVAHLAGALGKPVWTLLQFAPDFRWMLNRADSPWYPTMKLFRQERMGGWDGVMAQVMHELRSITKTS